MPNAAKVTPVDDELYGDAIRISVPKTDDYPEGLLSLGREIMEVVRQAYDDSRERHALVDGWRWEYEATEDLDTGDGPFEGSAHVHTPLIRNTTDVLHAELLRASTDQTPFHRLRSRRRGQEELVKKWEDFIQSQLENDIKYIRKLDGAYKRALVDGMCAIKDGWRREYRKERDRRLLDKDLLSEMGFNYDPARIDKEGVFFKGQQVSIGSRYIEVEMETMTANHPDGIRIDFHDFVIYPVRQENIENAILVGDREWLTRNDLLRGVHEGRFDKKAVYDFLDKFTPSGRAYATGGAPSEPEGENGADGRDSTNPQLPIPKHGEYEFFNVYYLFDADGDGLAESCAFTVHAESGTVIAAAPCPYWHGETPYTIYTPFPREGYFYGYSVCEILESLQEQLDTATNQKLDAGTLSLSPFISKVAGSNTNLQAGRIRPGTVFDVDAKGDIEIMNWNIPTQDSIIDIQMINEMAEKVSGVTDATAGVSPSRSRPLGETNALLERAGYRFEVIIGRVQEANARWVSHIISHNRQYLDEDTEYRLTGDREGLFETITKEELRLGLSIFPLGNNRNTSREMEMIAAEKLALFAERHPMFQWPGAQWEVAREFLKAQGRKDTESFIKPKEVAMREAEEAKNQPPPIEPPNLSGRLGEVVTFALLMRKDPGLKEAVAEAASLLEQLGIGEEGEAAKTVGLQQKLAEEKIGSAQRQMLESISHRQEMAQKDIDMALQDEQHASESRQKDMQLNSQKQESRIREGELRAKTAIKADQQRREQKKD